MYHRLPAVIALLVLCLAPSLAAAAPFALALPLDCRPGRDCWVANYNDVDAGAGAQDFRCGPRSYPAHDGVDFALRDLVAMARGVAVRAAAPGTVKGVRDGMADVALTDAAARARLAGRECGNGVLIEHGDGWQTQYCHLRRGSVRVRPGEVVAAGTPLAEVGLSGNTEFPHLHLAVRRGGTAIDPFTGLPLAAGCGAPGQALWRPDAGITYEPVALYNVGFAPGPADADAIRRGERHDGPYAAQAPALVLWVDMLGVRAGDRVRFVITAPDGRALLDTVQAVERTQARRFVFVGARRTLPAWPTGRYAGRVTLTRAGDGEVRTISTGVRIDAP